MAIFLGQVLDSIAHGGAGREGERSQNIVQTDHLIEGQIVGAIADTVDSGGHFIHPGGLEG